MSEKIKLIYCLSFLARNFRRLDKVGKASQFWSQFQLSFMNETFEFLVRSTLVSGIRHPDPCGARVEIEITAYD